MLQAPLGSSRSHPRIGRFSEAPWFLVLRRVGLAPSVWVPSVLAVTRVSLLLALSRDKTGTLCVNTSSLCGHTPGDGSHVSPSTLTASSARVHADVPGSAPAPRGSSARPRPRPRAHLQPPSASPFTHFLLYLLPVLQVQRFRMVSLSPQAGVGNNSTRESTVPCEVPFVCSLTASAHFQSYLGNVRSHLSSLTSFSEVVISSQPS